MLLWLATMGWAAAADEVAVVDVEEAPVIDGVLDEADWARAQPVTDFLRYRPTAGGPPDEHIEIRFLQDEKNLYVGIRVTGGKPPWARLAAREAINSDDQIGVYLDPFGTGETGYIFYFNPLGIQQDIQFISGRWITSWDTLLFSEGHATEDGFELEIAFPFRSMALPSSDGEPTDWGVRLTRKIPAEGYKYAWPELQPGDPRPLKNAGLLTGVRVPGHQRRLDVTPGVAFRANLSTETGWDLLDPWYDTVRPFLDIRAGLGPTTDLLATVMPDFSHVEPDTTPIQVNLEFAAQFTERRRFFTTTGSYFADAQRSLYTRHIVTPMYGANFTSRIGRWNVGILHTLDLDPARANRITPDFQDVDGKWGLTTVARLRNDLKQGGYVGFTLTDKHLVNDAFAGSDRADNATVGADVGILPGKRWSIAASASGSYTTNRTDEDGPDALWGGRVTALVERGSGAGFGVEFEGRYISNDFRQETAFLQRAGLFGAELEADWTVGTDGLLTFWAPVAAGYFEERFDGEFIRRAGGGLRFVLAGIHELQGTGGWQQTQQLDIGRQGLVDGWWGLLEYAGQTGSWAEWGLSFSGEKALLFDTGDAGLVWEASANTTLRPSTRLRMDLLGTVAWSDPTSSEQDPDHILPPTAGRQLLGRAKLSWQITREWGLRAIGQINDTRAMPLADLGRVERALIADGQVMASWLLNPFTSANVGYQMESRTLTGSAEDDGQVMGHGVFVRGNFLIRP